MGLEVSEDLGLVVYLLQQLEGSRFYVKVFPDVHPVLCVIVLSLGHVCTRFYVNQVLEL